MSPRMLQGLRRFAYALPVAVLVAACGGTDTGIASAPAPTKLLAQSFNGEIRSFAGKRADYAITVNPDGSRTVSPFAGGEAVVVPAAARMRFADLSLAFDIEGKAGQAYRLYKAAFNRNPDGAGLGFWIDAMNRGVSLEEVAAGFVQSAEYKGVYGANPGSWEIVDRYYRNILGRAGEQAGIDFWKGVLDRASASPAQVLAGFSESTENQVGVIAAIQSGVPYLEPGVTYVPVANAGPSRNVNVASLVTLDGSASTVTPGRPITYNWTMTSKPAGSISALVQTSSARPSFVPDLYGAYEITLTVSDGATTSAVAKTQVLVLWKPPAGSTPTSGNFFYMQSDAGDYIGGGKTRTFTQSDSMLSVTANGSHVGVSINGDGWWSADFTGPNAAARIEPGYYGDLMRYPFHNPVKGGLSISGDGRGCNQLTGWFMVDSVSYEGSTLKAIDLRYEQHCEGGSAALRGRLRWDANDTSSIPGPVNPPPAGLWQPAAGVTPATGNYVYLESMAGDYIGQGRNYIYTNADAKLTISGAGPRLSVSVNGNQWWSGDFVGMNTLSELQPGYYGNLQRYPFHNPVKGGLSWSGDGRGCNTLSGWFVVDKATYVYGSLTEIDLRFEQHCEGGYSALRGKIHWTAAGATASALTK